MPTHDPTTGRPPFVNRKLSIAEWLVYASTYDFGSIPPNQVVLHHTYKPTEATWNGLTTMQGMQKHYASLGWTSAPHIYAAPDGIWLATPMHSVGIHANEGNATYKDGKLVGYSIGLEMVGFFDRLKPNGAVWRESLAVMGGLSRRLSIPPRKLISFHRDYTDEKTCPGLAVTKEWVWSEVEAWLEANKSVPVPAPAQSLINPNQMILNGPSVPATTLIAWLDKRAAHLTWQQRSSLVCSYCAYGELTTIGNLLPFAQAWHETGGFTSKRFLESYNPAGLGATNDGAWGGIFISIAEGAAAQYAHLLCYAARPEALPLHLSLFAMLSPRHFALAGTHGYGAAPRWIDLNGKWAVPGTNYAQAIVKIATTIQQVLA